MSIEQNATLSSTPFGRAEVDEILATQAQSAHPNGAGGSGLGSIDISPLNGVKTETLCVRRWASVVPTDSFSDLLVSPDGLIEDRGERP